ncbi:hypothetical protein ASPCAL02579 [Aspergillus calidoustus]|uniref:DNA double-strand break repair and VJ recombination XRCC4 n=1 Tax=Aspergillus calidoustus TaxID=454130 RepID=A0A0U5GKY6_ASPCI|nr:hypothetical protein ASPCAL02579 [Aspergillus calidoustus]
MSPSKHVSGPRVVHIRRSDAADAHVLLHVSRTDSSTLELGITATEGDSPYTTTVRQAQLKNLRAKQYQGSDDEWRDTILHVLGLLEEPEKHSDLLTGIEVSATINGSGDEDKELVLTVRKRIQDITQKLGSLTLSQDDEQAIELFEWSNIAVARADSMEERYTTLLARFRTAEDTISSLNRQLDELISSKSLHEQQLMSDFVHLLNEKKLKIRNQQRLLASAKVDPEKLSTIQKATAADRSKPDAKGRNQKRSARAIFDDNSESDGGFEKMDVDQKQRADEGSGQETDDQEQSTPQPMEDEDTTTDDEGPAASTHVTKKEEKEKQGPPGRALARSPPPRRELPFARRAQKEPVPAKSPPAQDSDETEGETDDDEL